MAAIAGMSAGTPATKVELRIQCKDLVDKDVTSKSDPCVVLNMKTKGQWYEVGRTENIKNCQNPQFAKSFEVDYYFEEVQNLSFSVYDIDNQTEKLSDDDFLGIMECTMGQLVSKNTLTRPLLSRHDKQMKKSTITVTVFTGEENSGGSEVLHMNFKAQKLDNKDMLGKSDPFMEFYRMMPNSSWQVVHRTEVIKNNLNPTWKPCSVKIHQLCGGNYEASVKIVIYDYDGDGSHDLIGEVMTPVTALVQAGNQQTEWPVINQKKKAKKSSYKNSGTLYLMSSKITKECSFLDYISGGLQMNFTAAIDFTASNGDPRTPESLHYISPDKPNDYAKVIRAVGNVIQDYDSDKMFPALGFGARVPPEMKVSHEFALSFNPSNPFCEGIDGILTAYQACIQSIQLYGPTNFSPVIYHVCKFAQAAQKEEGARNYFVLLIITDGEITDMDRTCAAIVQASQLPMSIIIVGVGNADFGAMDQLDGDDGVLRAPNGQPCRRDIVQFVPFRRFAKEPVSELARQVLAEIPKQVTDYFKMMGIAPSVHPQRTLYPGAPPSVPST